MTVGSSTKALRALLISTFAVLAIGCPPRDKITIQGEITTVVKGATDGTGGGAGPVARGTWCCSACGAARPIKCTGCYAKTAAACVAGQAILLDCVGDTVQDGSTVTCY
jgi:hypothetical protein